MPDDPGAVVNRAAWTMLRAGEKPFLTAFSDKDPITHGSNCLLRAFTPGARGQQHVTITTPTTSCKKIKARNWPRSSSTSSTRHDGPCTLTAVRSSDWG